MAPSDAQIKPDRQDISTIKYPFAMPSTRMYFLGDGGFQVEACSGIEHVKKAFTSQIGQVRYFKAETQFEHIFIALLRTRDGLNL